MLASSNLPPIDVTETAPATPYKPPAADAVRILISISETASTSTEDALITPVVDAISALTALLIILTFAAPAPPPPTPPATIPTFISRLILSCAFIASLPVVIFLTLLST